MMGQRAREVLGKEIDRATVHRSPAGDDAVARDLRFFHAKFVRAVLDEHVEFLEGTLVEYELDAFAGCQLAPLVLGLDARLAAAETGFLTTLLKFVEDVLHSPLTPARHRAGIRPARGIPWEACIVIGEAWDTWHRPQRLLTSRA
jgi:hypothetical protein